MTRKGPDETTECTEKQSVFCGQVLINVQPEKEENMKRILACAVFLTLRVGRALLLSDEESWDFGRIPDDPPGCVRGWRQCIS